MLKLPLDLSSFERIRTLGYLYVDKTEYAYKLITGGRRFFLARPRRFGKTLFVSTLKEVLAGKKKLFTNLWINSSNYNWKPHGVITLDFSSAGIRDVLSFNKGVCHDLQTIASQHNLTVTLDKDSPEIALKDLVRALYAQFGAVAILIDEYDNPLLHTLHKIELATEIRDAMRRFFSTIKSLDAEIDFVFITGISSFSKAGIFSGMNNLQTITLHEAYAGICGYTETEIGHNFTQRIQDWADAKQLPYEHLRQEIKKWYNGYRFSTTEIKTYNPFSLTHALAAQAFNNYWFSSGTPTFLVDMIRREQRTFDPERLELSGDSLGALDIHAAPLVVLLFQTGYLTIVNYDAENNFFTLDYPNQEVKVSFQKYLLEALVNVNASTINLLARDFKLALHAKNIATVQEILLQLFAHIPYQLHMKEEKYYHSLMIMLCITAGIQVTSEYSTSDGRIDLVFNLPNRIYVTEIKFNKSPDQALAQIKERGYYKPFLTDNKPITLLGMSFMREPHHFDILIQDEDL